MTRKVALSTHETQPGDRATEKDQTRLQGTWCFLSGRRKADLIIEGERFSVRFQNGEEYRGTFKLDACRRPRQMDMTVLEGPGKHKDRTFLGLYELIGETMLKWCPGLPDLKHRLHEFPDLEDESFLTIVFKRPEPEWIGEAW
jgi:uncharacterized protein (TIGR03067 family)